MTVKRKIKLRTHGEDFLSDIEAIELTLENRKKVVFRFEEELPPLPDDASGLVKEADRTVQRLAFWSYQTERAKSFAKRTEEQADVAWAREYQTQRRAIQGGYVDSVEMPTENNIRSRVLLDNQLEEHTSRVRAAWKRYGALRALTTALEHRCHLIRLLLRREVDTRAFTG